MTADSARLLLGRRRTRTSSPIVSGFLPSVMERIHSSDIGLVIWRRFTRLNLLVSASTVLMGQPFTLTVTDTPDVAARRLCRDLTLFHWALYRDFRQLARRFAALTASSVVRMRLEHVIDDSCREFHVDAVGLRLLCTYAGPGTEWIGIVRPRLVWPATSRLSKRWHAGHRAASLRSDWAYQVRGCCLQACSWRGHLISAS